MGGEWAVLIAIFLWVLIVGVAFPRLVLQGPDQKWPSDWVEAFALTLEEGRTEPVSMLSYALGWGELLAEGKLEGRRIRFRAEKNLLRYEVEVPGSTASMFLTKQDLLSKADEGEASQAAAMRGALAHLFGVMGLPGLKLENGWLRVVRPSFQYAFTTRSLRGVFDQLIKIAPLYETREVHLQGVTGQGWTAGGDDVLCPYCRDRLEHEQAALEACRTCRTVHHAECFAEAGGCTVFGCEGGPRRDKIPA